jgi:hypothetical protein
MASKMMAGLKAKAAEAGKAKQAAKSAMADKMKTAAKDFMAKKSAAPARPTERIPRPAGTVSPNAAKMVGKPLGGMGGGMGSRAGMTRPTGPMGTMARPARPMGGMGMGMGMKKGGKTKK